MGSRVTELSCKEVINICDGIKYGFVNDVEIDCSCGKITALIVHGRGGFGSFFSRTRDIIIPWEAIRRIGEDLILVDFAHEYCEENSKKGIFSK